MGMIDVNGEMRYSPGCKSLDDLAARGERLRRLYPDVALFEDDFVCVLSSRSANAFCRSWTIRGLPETDLPGSTVSVWPWMNTPKGGPDSLSALYSSPARFDVGAHPDGKTFVERPEWRAEMEEAGMSPECIGALGESLSWLRHEG